MRTLLGVRNFADSASNLPFLVIGFAGIAHSLRAGRGAAWLAVFAGSIAIAFGSTYYHQAPDDARLLWDRLPIALTFMAFLVALLDDHLERPPGAAVLGAFLTVALALGAAGVFYWRETGDLRLYLWTQVVPLLAIPAVVLLFPARFPGREAYWWVFACYLAARATELADFPIFKADGGIVSGHTLKHLIAALGLALLLRMLAGRPRSPLKKATA